MTALHVVVTGGGRGVGAATARRFVQRGARVVIASRNAEELEATAESLRALGGADCVLGVVCDVSSSSSVSVLQQSALSFLHDRVDVLVNNAGIARRASVLEMTESTWDEVLDINLKGAWLCARAFVGAMVAREKGRVINVSSISATLGTPRMSAYCASKWGMVGFTKALAEEVRGAHVQVVALLPGSIDTQMLVGSGYAPAMSADDVAKMIEFYALDAPSAVTGSAVEMFG